MLVRLLLAKKRPRLGIQLHKAIDDNQSCHILMVILDRIYKLRVLKYNLYSSTFFYTYIYWFLQRSVMWLMAHGTTTPFCKRSSLHSFPLPLLLTCLILFHRRELIIWRFLLCASNHPCMHAYICVTSGLTKRVSLVRFD